MKKSKQYAGSLTTRGLRLILDSLNNGHADNKENFNWFNLYNTEEEWSVDDIDLFFSKYETGNFVNYSIAIDSKNSDFKFEIRHASSVTSVSIYAPTSAFIDDEFNLIDEIIKENRIKKTDNSRSINREYYFRSVGFSWSVIRKAIDVFQSQCSGEDYRVSAASLYFMDEGVFVDNIDLFSEKYEANLLQRCHLTLEENVGRKKFSISMHADSTTIELKSSDESDIARIIGIFKNCSEDERINIASEVSVKPKIFIGHGRNSQWEKLKSHLQDKHAVDVIAYETGNRAGHTIRDILDNMSSEASMALLVLTGEDKTDAGLRARQNVIHECGLFQGKLGFDRAILLVENGVELASNFDGIQQLRFKRSRISETFGDVIATIRREFGPV